MSINRAHRTGIITSRRNTIMATQHVSAAALVLT
jgi:hypothetical protein